MDASHPLVERLRLSLGPAASRNEPLLEALGGRLAALQALAAGRRPDWSGERQARAVTRRFLRRREGRWHDGDENLVRGLLDRWQGPGEDAARAMALGARRVLRTDVGIAVTGVAGPERQEDRPAGTVCLAVAIGEPGSAGEGECRVDSIEVRLPGRRRQVREFSVISLLGLLRRHLLEI